MQADIGVVGLAVMGQNIVLNMIDNGFRVAIYNRSQSKVETTYTRVNNKDAVVKCNSLEMLAKALTSPRIILVMVKAGNPVDTIIEQCIPLLQPGDVLIDGGNSNYKDTIQRTDLLARHGIDYVGMGISGGEHGARYGPSMMPGGSKKAWEKISTIFTTIAAQYKGNPCCAYLGPDGAGHFVKTVHNGIEYADMQLISEVYDLLQSGFNVKTNQLATIFDGWNQGKLGSFLIEITADIFKYVDESKQQPLVELIKDTAGQKGTGRWTVHSSLEVGEPLSLIASAVFQRFTSSKKSLRTEINQFYSYSRHSKEIPVDFLQNLEIALYSAKILSYAQGFSLLYTTSKQHNWNLDLALVASIWRAGCIIRSDFLDQIMSAYESNPSLQHLLIDSHFKDILLQSEHALREVISIAISLKIPVPAFSAALAYLDSIRSDRLPANLIQAQRDYFGAHGYQRIDGDDQFYHTEWKADL